jgi:hypothetical protein
MHSSYRAAPSMLFTALFLADCSAAATRSH